MWDLVVQPFADFGFMRRALLGCIAISVGATPVGVFLMLRRMSLTGEGLACAILPGVAVGYLVAGLSLLAMTLGGLVLAAMPRAPRSVGRAFFDRALARTQDRARALADLLLITKDDLARDPASQAGMDRLRQGLARLNPDPRSRDGGRQRRAKSSPPPPSTPPAGRPTSGPGAGSGTARMALALSPAFSAAAHMQGSRGRCPARARCSTGARPRCRAVERRLAARTFRAVRAEGRSASPGHAGEF